MESFKWDLKEMQESTKLLYNMSLVAVWSVLIE